MNRPLIKLTLLGTGTCVPEADRSSSGYFISYQEHTILLDCGSGILRRLAEAKIDFRTIETICLSHFHPDHTSDLAPFLLASNYTPRFERTKPLTIIGPVGLKKFLQNLARLYGPWIISPGYPLIIKELKNSPISIQSLSIFSAPVLHSAESLAYRIETSDQRSVTYSGDTDYNPSLIKLAKNSDLLLIECSFPKPEKTAGHLTPEEVGKIARESNSKKVVLTHIYPVFENFDPVPQVKNYYDGEVIQGRDLMIFQI